MMTFLKWFLPPPMQVTLIEGYRANGPCAPRPLVLPVAKSSVVRQPVNLAAVNAEWLMARHRIMAL
jgi:hypothetical protein